MQELFVDELYEDGLSGVVYSFDKFVCDLRKISPLFYMEAKKYVTQNVPFHTIVPVGRFICIVSLDLPTEEWKMAFVDTKGEEQEAEIIARVLKSKTDSATYRSFMDCFYKLKPTYAEHYGEYELVKLFDQLSDEVYNISDFIEA